MKFLFLLPVFFAALAGAEAREPYRTTHEHKFDARYQTALMREVRSYMDSVVFPKVVLKDMTFANAVTWVQNRIRDHAPASVPTNRRGLSIFLKLHPDAPETISVSLRKATLPEVLDAICAEHDYVWCVEPSILSIVPRIDAFPSKPSPPRGEQGAVANGEIAPVVPSIPSAPPSLNLEH